MATENANFQDSAVARLYGEWVKAGPPPIGVSLARWWDARLVELGDAIRQDAQTAD